MCDCGCGTCDTKSKLTLNENLAPKEILSEGLKFHLDNNRPLTENVYRAGSEEYFNVWSEARSLYSRGIINVTEDDKEILTETNLGEFGIVEGMKVPLDFPMEDEVKENIKEDITPQEIEYYALHSDLLSNLSKALDDKDFNEKYRVLKTLLKDRPKRLEALDYFFKVLNPSKEREELPVAEAKNNKSVVNEEFPGKGEIVKAKDLNYDMLDYFNRMNIKLLINTKSKKNIKGSVGIMFNDLVFNGDDIDKKDIVSVEILESVVTEAKTFKKGDKLKIKSKNGKEFDVIFDRYLAQNGMAFGKFKDEYGEFDVKPFSLDTIIDESLTEDKKSNKKLNKPMRDSSGGKAYKVYVKDPKTKKIKTVRFGSGGLKAKINNKKARTAFAKRHDCANKKDKTKAGYWSCRLPRYAKLLGLKSSFSGFW